jgi:hypothetical protein
VHTECCSGMSAEKAIVYDNKFMRADTQDIATRCGVVAREVRAKCVSSRHRSGDVSPYAVPGDVSSTPACRPPTCVSL